MTDAWNVQVHLGAPLGMAFAVCLAWLVLFALRRRTSGALLLASVAALHALPVLVVDEVAPSPGLTAMPSWIAITAWPLLVLVVHVRDGTHRARQLALAAMAGVLSFTAVAAMLSADPLVPMIRGLCRSVLAFTSAVAVVAAWEVLGKQRVVVPLRLMGALLLALAFDAASQGCFEALVRGEAFEGHVLGAMVVAVVTSSMHGAIGALWLLVLEGERWLSDRSDVALLDVLGIMLGTRRYQPLRPSVVRDEPSGLYHRTFLEDRVPVELERADHLAATVAVLVLDARDQPDRVGRALLSSMRLTDLPGRWAEERYVAVLPGADREAARTSARRAIEGFRGEAAVGLAVFPQDGNDLEQLVQVAARRSQPVLRL
ncbi:MAG: GGDEF domain-containing protein [Myxococcales bacterium]|nr:GGDEF domain-containing protein [Myxococcales bacterium]